MAAGAAIERLSSMSLSVRHAQDRDQAVLAGWAIAFGPDQTAFVGEMDGSLIGAVGIAARPFESECLSRRVASIGALATLPNRSAELAGLLAGALYLLVEDGMSLLSCRRPETNVAEIAALNKAGFREVERLITLSRPFNETAGMPDGISMARPEDVETCAAIAGEAFSYDRFHVDPRVDNSAADRLKAQWARNSLRGRADAVFVARDGDKAVGFNACMLAGDTAVIDLICVAGLYRGRGIARALTHASLAHYAGKAKEMKVGTQSTNGASLALYRMAGFRDVSTAVTLHAHLS